MCDTPGQRSVRHTCLQPKTPIPRRGTGRIHSRFPGEFQHVLDLYDRKVGDGRPDPARLANAHALPFGQFLKDHRDPNVLCRRMRMPARRRSVVMGAGVIHRMAHQVVR